MTTIQSHAHQDAAGGNKRKSLHRLHELAEAKVGKGVQEVELEYYQRKTECTRHEIKHSHGQHKHLGGAGFVTRGVDENDECVSGYPYKNEKPEDGDGGYQVLHLVLAQASQVVLCLVNRPVEFS